jgi:hypothetical protein
MKWLSNSWNFTKTLSLTLSTFTMVMTPVAQGAEAAKKAPVMKTVKVKVDETKFNWKVDANRIQQLMKNTGLAKNKRMTVGEFYSKIRPFYPMTQQRYLDLWMVENHGMQMPEIQVTTYKDSDDKEQIRLLLTKNGQTVSLSFNSNSREKFVKVNNTDLSRMDVLFFENAYRKLAKGDKVIAKDIQANRQTKPVLMGPTHITFEKYKRLSPRDKAAYLMRIRELLAAAQKVHDSFGSKKQASAEENKYEYFAQWIFGLQAQAVDDGDGNGDDGGKGPLIKGARHGQRCWVAGFNVTYNKATSCGGGPDGSPARKELLQKMQESNSTCPPKQIGCNKLLYNNDGATICMKNPSSELRSSMHVDGYCSTQSPLRPGSLEDKEKLINGYLKSTGSSLAIKIEEDGKDGRLAKNGMSDKEYAEAEKTLREYMKTVSTFVDEGMELCGTFPQTRVNEARSEQKLACDGLLTRKFNLDFYTLTPPPTDPPTPPPTVTENCSVTSPGSTAGPSGQCECLAPKQWVDKPGEASTTVRYCEIPEVIAAVEEVEKCTDDKTKKVTTNEDASVKNEATASEDGATKKERCGCKGMACVGGWIFPIAILGIGALGYGAYALFGGKKDDPKPMPPVAVDVCPPQTTNPLTCVSQNPPPVTPPPPVSPPPPIIDDPTTPPPGTAVVPDPVNLENTGATAQTTTGGVGRSQGTN